MQFFTVCMVNLKVERAACYKAEFTSNNCKISVQTYHGLAYSRKSFVGYHLTVFTKIRISPHALQFPIHLSSAVVCACVGIVS